ncbi:hypothetical protein B566_EDAN002868 [Ephemera danica]|nr:hypothetical protein B566_EDAN002868 [Ephemera danica]
MHHPVRRRKRRSHGVCSSNNFNSIGVRAVDVVRGHNGFGFTISGQQPCLLSCIVAGSPAEAAGLRPGHALVAVNGRSVAKLPHDTVVRLIGSCAGTLRLHVAENYYPHSSDSDVEDVDAYLPRRPAQGRAARVVRDLHTGAMFVEKSIPACSPPLQLPPRGAQNPPPPPPPSRIQPSDFRAVVGYLGTIELPKVLLPGSKLAVIRSCVRRMRAEKRVHTTVMLIVRKEQSVILADSLGTILAEFVAERVAFCGACADDKRFFGLVTSVTSVDDDDDDVSAACGGSSCHVFMVDPSVHPHPAHEQRAAAFRIVCTASGEGCAEFPALADPILRAVAALYNPASPPPPPPRSNTSSCPSSNSDSGIGFREEPALVEESTAQERLTVRAMPDPPCVAVLQQQQLKLSPKVYGLPVAQSLEDLPPAAAALEPSGDESMSSLEHHQHWGSLQDLRTMPVRHPHQAQPSGRRRKHTTHHQHPPSSSHSSISAANSMPPPQLVASASLSQPMLASLSVPSSVPSPQPSDDETDVSTKLFFSPLRFTQ